MVEMNSGGVPDRSYVIAMLGKIWFLSVLDFLPDKL